MGVSPFSSATFELAIDRVVGFVEVLPALGVADDDVRDVDGGQHGRRDFAGEGALFLPVHVLRADGDIRAGAAATAA